MMYWVKLILISIFLILCILLGWWILVGKSQSYTLAEIFCLWFFLSLAAVVGIPFSAFVAGVFSENEASTASSASSNAAVNNNNLSRNNNATVNNNRSRGVEAANGRRRIVENGSDVRNTAPQLSDNDSIIGHRRLDL